MVDPGTILLAILGSVVADILIRWSEVPPVAVSRVSTDNLYAWQATLTSSAITHIRDVDRGFAKGDSPEGSETPGRGWYPPPHGLLKNSGPNFFLSLLAVLR